jgi:hypothetical protein
MYIGMVYLVAMSNHDVPPKMPDCNSPVAAYNDFYEGLVFRDVSQIREAATRIEDTDFPLAEEVEDMAYELEQVLQDSESGNEERIDLAITKALRSAMQSQVYSECSLEAKDLLFIAQLLGKDEKWLYRTLEPHPTVLGVIFEDEGLSRRELRQKSNHAFRIAKEIGVLPFEILFLGKLLVRLGPGEAEDEAEPKDTPA